jgi:hypothetical protein
MQLNLNNIIGTCIWTTNTLYREYTKNISEAKEKGYSVVNMDTSHLYAVKRPLVVPKTPLGVPGILFATWVKSLKALNLEQP